MHIIGEVHMKWQVSLRHAHDRACLTSMDSPARSTNGSPLKGSLILQRTKELEDSRDSYRKNVNEVKVGKSKVATMAQSFECKSQSDTDDKIHMLSCSSGSYVSSIRENFKGDSLPNWNGHFNNFNYMNQRNALQQQFPVRSPEFNILSPADYGCSNGIDGTDPSGLIRDGHVNDIVDGFGSVRYNSTIAGPRSPLSPHLLNTGSDIQAYTSHGDSPKNVHFAFSNKDYASEQSFSTPARISPSLSNVEKNITSPLLQPSASKRSQQKKMKDAKDLMKKQQKHQRRY